MTSSTTHRPHRRVRTRSRSLVGALAAGALLALTACSGGSTAGAGGLGGAAGGDGAAGGGMTLVIPTSQAPWNPAYAKVIDLYEKESGNTVELRQFPNDEVKTQEVNDVNSGADAFDVYQVNEADLAQFMANDWLRPLTDVDPGYALDPEVYTYDNLTNWDADTQLFNADGVLTSVPINGNLSGLLLPRRPVRQARPEAADHLGRRRGQRPGPSGLRRGPLWRRLQAAGCTGQRRYHQ